MDLIYTDAALGDVGVIDAASSDWAYGSDENDFEVVVRGKTVPPVGALVYAEGGEVGGIVRGYKEDAGDGTVTVTGDTWSGVLGSKVVGPDSGSDYLVLSGDVRDVVAALVTRAGLDGLFSVSAHTTGVSVTHTFKGNRTDSTQQDAGRYMTAWAAVWQVLADHGCSVSFRWDAVARRVSTTVDVAADGDDERMQSATVGVTTDTPVNHLVCLGSGELKDRAVAHVYLGADGTPGTTQYYTGLHEVADVYESTNDSGDDLVSAGESKLADIAADAVSVTVDVADGLSLALGDRVSADSSVLGRTVSAVVSKKVIKTDGAAVSSTYETSVA